MKFGQRIQTLRRGKNLTQEELAEKTGVSRQAVAKWETGESLPEIENLIILSELLGTSIDRMVKDSYDENCNAHASSRNPDAAILPLVEFLRRSKRATYAGKGAETISSRTASHDLKYSEGDYQYYDTYLGGEKFAGEEAVWESGTPVWSMNYAGRVLEASFSGDFLKECLALVPEEYPYRGPLVHRNGDYDYHCLVNGCLSWFNGYEEIFCKGLKVYECVFHGGRIQ